MHAPCQAKALPAAVSGARCPCRAACNPHRISRQNRAFRARSDTLAAPFPSCLFPLRPQTICMPRQDLATAPRLSADMAVVFGRQKQILKERKPWMRRVKCVGGDSRREDHGHMSKGSQKNASRAARAQRIISCEGSQALPCISFRYTLPSRIP